MNPIIIETMLKERRQEMLQEAERLRLIAQYEANNPRPRAKIVIALANLLIRTGQKMKQRYEQQVELPVTLCKE